MSTIVGIDLGTTHSSVAFIDSDGPRLIANALGDVLTPSIVGIDEDGRVLVGRPAKELQVTHPTRVAALFKRRMGTDWSIKLAGKRFTPEELSGWVLRSLKQDAEAHLGGPVTRAVITVPAYFNEHQRKATLNAGEIAGLKVERILNEPTAAAMAYGFHDAGTDRILLICDLGGGTFDVSIVEVGEGMLEVRASSGEGFLGGEDFTRAIAARVLETQGGLFERAEMSNPVMVARLVQQCEMAKRALSRSDTVDVRVPDKRGEFPAGGAVITVSRDQFQRWTEPILAQIEPPIRRALGDAKLTRDEIDQVILVGGATRMANVVDRVTTLFNKPPLCTINPDEVVAMGAAIQAGLFARDASLNDLVVTDVAPFSLGIQIAKELGDQVRTGYFLPIINRNTTIPVSRVQHVATLTPNQTKIVVQIYQGEGRRVEDNLLLGSFAVKNIPAGPAGQSIQIRFTYDLNGVLEVEAVVSATLAKFTHVVTDFAHGLSPDQITAAVDAMAELKAHPREEASTRLLLRWAERLFAELAPHVRTNLGILLDGFESALETRDPQAIAANRLALEQFLVQNDPSHEANDGGNGGNDLEF